MHASCAYTCSKKILLLQRKSTNTRNITIFQYAVYAVHTIIEHNLKEHMPERDLKYWKWQQIICSNKVCTHVVDCMYLHNRPVTPIVPITAIPFVLHSITLNNSWAHLNVSHVLASCKIFEFQMCSFYMRLLLLALPCYASVDLFDLHLIIIRLVKWMWALPLLSLLFDFFILLEFIQIIQPALSSITKTLSIFQRFDQKFTVWFSVWI